MKPHQRHDLVTVNDIAQLIHRQKPVGVTVLLQVIVETGKPLSELKTVMEVMPQALVNAKVPNHSKPQIGLLKHYPRLQLFHMGGTAVGIDIRTVRIVVDRHYLCPKLFHLEFNGIKFFDGNGYKLPDSLEDEIEELIRNNLPILSYFLSCCFADSFILPL